MTRLGLTDVGAARLRMVRRESGTTRDRDAGQHLLRFSPPRPVRALLADEFEIKVPGAFLGEAPTCNSQGGSQRERLLTEILGGARTAGTVGSSPEIGCLNPSEEPMERNTRVDLPEEWKETTFRGPTAVAVLVRHCHVGHRIARHMYGDGVHPKLNTRELLEDSQVWSSGERKLVLAIVNLFNSDHDVPLASLAAGLDDRNWEAFMAALRQYRRA